MDEKTIYRTLYIIIGKPKTIRRAVLYTSPKNIKFLRENTLIIEEQSFVRNRNDGHLLTTSTYRGCIMAEIVSNETNYLWTSVWFGGKRLGWRPKKDCDPQDVVFELQNLLTLQITKNQSLQERKNRLKKNTSETIIEDEVPF